MLKESLVRSAECSKEVRWVGTLLGAFPTANMPLMTVCRDELKQCVGPKPLAELTEPESSGAMSGAFGALLACLQQRRSSFSEKCADKVGAQEVLVFREMEYNAEMKATCRTELSTHCADEKGPHQLACLGRVRAAGLQMGPRCSKAVLRYTTRASESLTLMSWVREPCEADYALLCGGTAFMQLPGAEMQCLKDNLRSLRNEQCKAAVREVVASVSEDARLDPILVSTCKSDIDACAAAGVQPGRGRINACLRRRMFSKGEGRGRIGSSSSQAADAFNDMLVELAQDAETVGKVKAVATTPLALPCAQQVFKSVALEAEHPALSFPLRKACKRELREYCAEAGAEQGQGLACLELHQRERDFSAPCATAVRGAISLALNDYRLLPVVAKECAVYVGSQCAGGGGIFIGLAQTAVGDSAGGAAGAGEAAWGSATPAHGVLQCLLLGEERNALPEACGKAVRDAARSAFVHFEWSRGITRQCDADIFGKCASRPALAGGRQPAWRREDVDVNQDGVYSGEEAWPCITAAAHASPESFVSLSCLTLVRMLAPHKLVRKGGGGGGGGPRDARLQSQHPLSPPRPWLSRSVPSPPLSRRSAPVPVPAQQARRMPPSRTRATSSWRAWWRR